MSGLETAINAYELCSRVLAASDWDAAALIEVAGGRGREANWLECKAACELSPADAAKGESAEECRRRVAKAITAMSNTHNSVSHTCCWADIRPPSNL